MGKGYLGEFEQMILLAVLQMGDRAFGLEIRREIEEEARDRRQHSPLVGNRRGEHDVEDRHAVGGDHQQAVLPCVVEIAHLPPVEVRQGDRR